MRKYDSVFFDLDGTLTDSGKGIKHCARYAYEKLGISCPDEKELDTFIGPPLADSFAAHAVPADQVDEAVRLFRSLYNKTGKFENECYAGIPECLAVLKENGLRLYVATSKPQTTAVEVLDHFHLTQYFERISGSDSVKITKADVIAELLQNADRTHVVMVGDTKYDVIGARRQGIACIGVSWGYGKREELSKADIVVDTPEELVRILL